VRESPLAVSVGAAPPQPLHPPAEGHVLRRAAAAVRDGQRAVVQRRGGQEIQVQGGTATRFFFSASTLPVIRSDVSPPSCVAARGPCRGFLR